MNPWRLVRGYQQARANRFARLDELRRRWDEEHAKLKALLLMYKQKAAYNDGRQRSGARASAGA